MQERCKYQTKPLKKKGGGGWGGEHCIIYATCLVFPLAGSSVHHIHFAIKAGCHLEGLDKLCSTHATGSLCDDASETHLLL